MDNEKNFFDNNKKEEKNLFSIASQEIEEEKSINSFSEALKELNDQPENKQEISFGNLFKTVENLEQEETTKPEETIVPTDEKPEIEVEDSKEEVNPFFQEETTPPEETVVPTEEEPKIEVEEPKEEVNPFFQEETTPPEETVAPTEEETKIEVEEPKEEVNPFFQEETTETEEIVVPTEGEPEIEVEESKEEVNPLFQEETTEPEENVVPTEEEPKIEVEETKEEVNPFFQEKTINDALGEVQEKIEVNNPFLEEKKDSIIAPIIIEDTTKKEKTSNPFFQNNPFEEQKDNSINPFFQNNKIELNEKQVHQNSNNKLDLTNVPHYNVKIQKKKPTIFKMIVGVLSYALFIWLLLIGIALLVYVANIKIKQMKGDFSPPKYNAYVVLTGSMLPHIKVEDVVVTKKIEPAELQEGDIITFASSDDRYYGTIITHRILKKYYDSTTGKYTFQSKGDNNNVADNALVEEQNIYGKVIMKIPKLGYLQVFLASQGGWILVILIPCAVVISFDIMKLFKMIASKRKLKIAK